MVGLNLEETCPYCCDVLTTIGDNVAILFTNVSNDVRYMKKYPRYVS